KAADLDITLLEQDTHQLPRGWNKKIGLLYRDIHGADTFLADLRTWHRFIPVGGSLLFRCKPPPEMERVLHELGFEEEGCDPHLFLHEFKRVYPTPRRAAFWIVSPSYLREAEESARTFARYMPDVQRYLFVFDGARQPTEVFQKVCPLGPRTHALW